jgi:lysophospholipase L1-like esterase
MQQFFTLFFLILLSPINKSFSQISMVVLGSSTAAGTGASVYDSAWAGKLQLEFRKNTSAGNPDTVVVNLAVGGYVTYQVMPTGYTPPAGRPAPDPDHNATKALSFSPAIIIINLPTNDIGAGYTPKEYMDNLRYLLQYINNAGSKVYITTTQPRSQYDFNKRLSLFQLVDSINNNFGSYAIDFWTDLATTDGQYNLLPEVNSGDDIHVNNLGHRLLFQKVKAKNIFADNAPLPLSLFNFQAQVKDNSVILKWHAELQEPNSFFEIQRCAVNKEFKAMAKENVNDNGLAADYSWLDDNPLPGKSLYRLKIIEPRKISYSKAVEVSFNKKSLVINELYSSSNYLYAEIVTAKSGVFSIRIINGSGAVVQEQTNSIIAPGSLLSIPIAKLAEGQYFLQVEGSDVSDIKRFVRLK